MSGVRRSSHSMGHGFQSREMIGKRCFKLGENSTSGGDKARSVRGTSRIILTASTVSNLMSQYQSYAPIQRLVLMGFGYSEKIITGSRDQTIKVWDIHTGICIRTLGHGRSHSHDLSSLIPVPGNGIAGARSSSTFEYHRASVLCLQFDDEILVSGSSDFTCIIWSLPSYTPIKRLRHHTAGVLDVCFDKKHIVSCSKDTTICVWDRKTGTLLRLLTGHCGPVNAIAIRGNLIVSASGDALIKLWSIDTGKCIRDFVGHNRGLACVQFSEDARTIVSGGNDEDIRMWDARSGECLRTMTGHKQLVRTLHLDSQNKRIISGSYDKVCSLSYL